MSVTENIAPGTPKERRNRLRLVPILEPRQNVGEWYRLCVYAVSLISAAVLSVVLLAASGVPPADLASEIAVTAFSSPRALASVLGEMAPLVVAGLATAIAFRSNFWNIGLEGQMILGSIFATAVAIYDIGPDATRLPLMALAAALGGMVWILGPALLKSRLGVNEVITTLLLNYVALNLLLHLLYGGWKDPVSSFPHSEQYEPFERLLSIGWQNLTWTLPIAGVLALVLWWVHSFSRIGCLLDFLSQNRDMARAMGLPVLGLSLGAVLCSGAVGGLNGFLISAGVEGRMTQGLHAGFLFNGVLIAFIGRNHPLGVLVTAFFMAVLIQLGQSLQVFFGTPFAVVRLTQAIFIIFVAGSEFFLTYRMHFKGAS